MLKSRHSSKPPVEKFVRQRSLHTPLDLYVLFGYKNNAIVAKNASNVVSYLFGWAWIRSLRLVVTIYHAALNPDRRNRDGTLRHDNQTANFDFSRSREPIL
jgi:hypothetical protein